MKDKHWTTQSERGNIIALTLTRWIVKYLPLWVVRFITFWVVLYFYLTSSHSRKNIQRYHQYLYATFPEAPKVTVFKQFMAFGEALTDRFAVWQHKIQYQDLIIEDPDNIHKQLHLPQGIERGQILVCSHLGNIEICRAFADKYMDLHLNVLVHDKNAVKFNQTLQAVGMKKLTIIQVSELGIDTMLDLQNRLDKGEWIIVAGDRIPIKGSKTEKIEFLGQLAEFPQGAWLLAILLKASINTIFCTKQDGRYHVKLERLDINRIGRHTKRQENIQQAIKKYADLLAKECANNPHLWFNFYDFWNDSSL